MQCPNWLDEPKTELNDENRVVHYSCVGPYVTGIFLCETHFALLAVLLSVGNISRDMFVHLTFSVSSSNFSLPSDLSDENSDSERTPKFTFTFHQPVRESLSLSIFHTISSGNFSALHCVLTHWIGKHHNRRTIPVRNTFYMHIRNYSRSTFFVLSLSHKRYTA